MPKVQADSHRGKISQALQIDDWMDCHDVAEVIKYSMDDASKVLGDVCRTGYGNRRDAENQEDVEYEYQLKTNISIR